MFLYENLKITISRMNRNLDLNHFRMRNFKESYRKNYLYNQYCNIHFQLQMVILKIDYTSDSLH